MQIASALGSGDEAMSYEYASSTEGDESHSDSSEEVIPDKVPTITAEEVIAKMKDQLDAIKDDV